MLYLNSTLPSGEEFAAGWYHLARKKKELLPEVGVMPKKSTWQKVSNPFVLQEWESCLGWLQGMSLTNKRTI